MRRLPTALPFILALACADPAAAKMPSACAFLAAQINPAAGPAFIASYPTVGSGPLHGVAYLYDNAAAAIAMVGCGEIDRARVIGDAILWAQDHDRAWHDGRLRNGYAAGRVADDPVKLAGWWDKGQERWVEDGYQAGTDTGNMAWAMLALLALDRAVPEGDGRYRKAAVRIGEWTLTRRNDDGPGGYTGGYYGWEGDQRPQSWKSTEHNTDLAAAFTLLAAATKDSAWNGQAAEAARFVKAMWFDACACFATGTLPDGVTPNRVVALDAQIWPLLAIPGLAESAYAASLATSESRLRDHHEPKTREGFTYSDASNAPRP